MDGKYHRVDEASKQVESPPFFSEKEKNITQTAAHGHSGRDDNARRAGVTGSQLSIKLCNFFFYRVYLTMQERANRRIKKRRWRIEKISKGHRHEGKKNTFHLGRGHQHEQTGKVG